MHTPYIDHFLANGAILTSAYTPAPICVPAQCCLWTGQTAATNGCTAGNTSDPWDFEYTLPGELANAGNLASTNKDAADIKRWRGRLASPLAAQFDTTSVGEPLRLARGRRRPAITMEKY